MRFLIHTVISVALSVAAVAQNVPISPSWPDIPMVSCPALTPPSDQSQRTWKHGQFEQDSFNASVGAFQAKNYTEAADRFAKFAEEYPDSDYREAAIGSEMVAQSYLKNKLGLIQAAAKMIRLPVASATSREMAFVTLCDTLSPYVRPDDPEEDRKLADLENWTRCGEEALTIRLSLTPAMPQAASEKTRKISDSVLKRTAGFIAYMRQDYAQANEKLEAASQINPDDALTYLWLATTKFFLPTPDVNSGIFYLARFANLAPLGYGAAPGATHASAALLKQIYVIVHGSDKGLSEVMELAKSSTVPPPGFNVLPKPKTEHHYGSAIASTAIVGLLIYGLAAHPDLMGEIGRSFAASVAPKPQKLMVFGGPGHRVYLGCLSCSEVETDSVFNPIGPHGSKVSGESIWNVVSEYGSPVAPYSACNPLAADPPVIVDENGNAYGRLTLNRLSPQIGAGARFYDWLSSVVCRH